MQVFSWLITGAYNGLTQERSQVAVDSGMPRSILQAEGWQSYADAEFPFEVNTDASDKAIGGPFFVFPCSSRKLDDRHMIRK